MRLTQESRLLPWGGGILHQRVCACAFGCARVCMTARVFSLLVVYVFLLDNTIRVAKK